MAIQRHKRYTRRSRTQGKRGTDTRRASRNFEPAAARPLRNRQAMRYIQLKGKLYPAGIYHCFITGEHSNHKQMWCVNIREHMAFGSIVGSDYNISPPCKIWLARENGWGTKAFIGIVLAAMKKMFPIAQHGASLLRATVSTARQGSSGRWPGGRGERATPGSRRSRLRRRWGR